MRVLHCGGILEITEALVAAEQQRGLTSEMLLPEHEGLFYSLPHSPVCEWWEEILAFSPQVLVLHGALAVGGASLEDCQGALEFLRELRGRGVRNIYWSQGSEPFVSPRAQELYDLSPETISASFSDLLLSSAEGLPLRAHFPNASWMPFGLPDAIFQTGSPREYPVSTPHEFSALHVSYQSPPPQLERMREASSGIRPRLALTHIDPASVKNLTHLVELIQASDVVIEALDAPSYGIIGAIAMAAARPLLSGNSLEPREIWAPFEMAPITPAKSADLASRLQGLLVEPRTLRDFGRRSRTFAESYHRISRIANLLEQRYRS